MNQENARGQDAQRLTVASASVLRAYGGLFLPLLILLGVDLLLDRNGYALIDILRLVAAGELTWWKQAGLLAFLVYFLGYISPACYRIIKSKGVLVGVCDGVFSFALSRFTPLTSDIRDAKIEVGATGKRLVLSRHGAADAKVWLLYLREPEDEVIARVLNIAGK